jgi:hypothetical protein
MTPDEMTPEEMMRKLDASYQAHLKEQEIINQFILALEKKAKDLVSEHFSSEVTRLSAEGYRALDNKINMCAGDLAVDICNIFDEHTED